MKKLNKLSLFALSALAFAGLATSCASDDLKVDDTTTTQPSVSTDGYYLSFTLNADGAATRAGNYTDENGNSNQDIAGAEKENKFTDAVVYFLNATDNKVLYQFSVADNVYVETGNSTDVDSGVDDTKQIASLGDNKYQITYKVTQVEDLVVLCGNFDVKVVVVGNGQNSELTDKFTYTLNSKNGSTDGTDAGAKTTTFTSKLGGLIQEFGKDQKGKVLPLTSYQALTISTFKNLQASDSYLIPIIDKFEGSYSKTNASGKLLNLTPSTPIQLERAVARVDFKDRTSTEREAEDVLKNLEATTKDYLYQLGTTNAIVKLVSLEVKNMNPTSYLFRHAIKGTAASAYGISTNSEELLLIENGDSSGDTYNWVSNPDWTGATFTTRSLSPEAESGSESIAKLATSDLTNKCSTTEDGYYGWLYIPENTVPTTALMTDENLAKYATGIEFTFQVMGKDGSTALSAQESGKSNWPEGVSIVNDNNQDKLRIMQPDGHYKDFDIESDKTVIIKITGYLKHNDKTTNATLDPMEYGVVRNNVYQCKVSSIGLTDWQEPEPLYIQLQVEVKKWQKRQNDFVF